MPSRTRRGGRHRPASVQWYRIAVVVQWVDTVFYRKHCRVADTLPIRQECPSKNHVHYKPLREQYVESAAPRVRIGLQAGYVMGRIVDHEPSAIFCPNRKVRWNPVAPPVLNARHHEWRANENQISFRAHLVGNERERLHVLKR